MSYDVHDVLLCFSLGVSLHVFQFSFVLVLLTEPGARAIFMRILYFNL